MAPETGPDGTERTDPETVRTAAGAVEVRGHRLAYTRAGAGGVPLLLVHGWPETRRIWGRVLAPLAATGFDVIAPDLRGFGDSEDGPDGYGDVPTHSRDLHALVTGALGLDRVVVGGGDAGGSIAQDMALRFPDVVDRMVLFNAPLPYVAGRMRGLRTRPPAEVVDYYVRQGTDADALAAELRTPEERRRYVAQFYTSRLWAHPGAFTPEEVALLTEPFGAAASLRASFRLYESVFDAAKRSEPALLGPNDATPTMVLFGPSDAVIHPDFDRMAAALFTRIVGPFLLRDCGHFVQWEAAATLVNATRAFCADLLGGPA